MGLRGDGLYDNDAALEGLDDLAYSIDLELTPAHLAAGLGLLAWLMPSALASEETGEALESLDDDDELLEALPEQVTEKIAAIAEDPEAFTRKRHARSQELLALLGSAEDGPREEALLKISGGSEVLEELAEECRSRLDQSSRDWPELELLTGELALLGPLAELRAFGVTCAPDRVQRWRAAFEKAAAAPMRKREEWDGYLANVRQLFKILESDLTRS